LFIKAPAKRAGIADSSHTSILTDKGLYGRGDNRYGQLELGHTDNLYESLLVQTLVEAIKSQSRQQRLFQYLLRASQLPHFFPTGA